VPSLFSACSLDPRRAKSSIAGPNARIAIPYQRGLTSSTLAASATRIANSIRAIQPATRAAGGAFDHALDQRDCGVEIPAQIINAGIERPERKTSLLVRIFFLRKNPIPKTNAK
jgi:hypothetical protein